MIIKFIELGGEFCTRRNSQALPQIKKLIEGSILKNESIICDWTGVKILTPSFIDEFMPELILKYGIEKINALVSFNPKLEGFLAHQIERGVKNRTT